MTKQMTIVVIGSLRVNLQIKMFVKMVAKLVFERAVILGIFTGSSVFNLQIKSRKVIETLCDF